MLTGITKITAGASILALAFSLHMRNVPVAPAPALVAPAPVMTWVQPDPAPVQPQSVDQPVTVLPVVVVEAPPVAVKPKPAKITLRHTKTNGLPSTPPTSGLGYSCETVKFYATHFSKETLIDMGKMAGISEAAGRAAAARCGI